tara:strand:+ start:6169 stop:6360 length:192 start_codon:yes stop_codon:yes gene_type:complete
MAKPTPLEELNNMITYRINTLENDDTIPYDMKLGQVLALSKVLSLVKDFLMEEAVKKARKSVK